MPKAVVYMHEETEGPVLLGAALEAAGYEVEAKLRAPDPRDASAELLVVMGGFMGAYQSDRHPFLDVEVSVIQSRLASDAPVIGVCLGAQLMAKAAGAPVYKGKQGMELGVFPVMLTDEGAADPLFGTLPRTTEAAHWHGDTFDPVPGATLLMSSDRYRWQAFKLGKSYGIQFHPELDVETLARWMDESPDDVHASGRYVEELRQDDLPKLKKAVPTWRAFLERLVRSL